jgi:hypothetical protein
MALVSVGLGAELFAPKRRFMVGWFHRLLVEDRSAVSWSP